MGFLARLALTPAVGPTALPFIFFFPGVALAAWFGRWGPGAFAALLATATASWFFFEPTNSFSVQTPYDIAAIAAFLVSCAFIVGAAEMMHVSRRRLRHVATEHKRASAALEASRDTLFTTLASIGDAVISCDANGRVTFLNREAERLTGWTAAGAGGQPVDAIFCIVNEESGDAVESPVARVLREQKTVGLANHTVLVARDGTRTPIADSAAPIRRPGGPAEGVVLTFRDVTEQRAADIAHARLASVVQFSGDAILTKTLDGVIQTWNASAERLFGWRADEIVGRPVTLLIPPDRLDEEPEILERLQRGQTVERRETVRVTKDGRRLPVLLSVSPLRDRDGRIVGASKIVHDLTAVAAARDALRREKELLATTLASIGDGVIVTDAHGRVTSLNPQAEALTGWTSAEAQGRDLASVFPIVNEQTRKPVDNPVHRVLEHGTIVGLANHTVLVARDGVERSIDDSAAPIRDVDGGLVGAVLVFRDITSRRQAERLVQASDRRKDEFLAILSHELRNPLAPVRMAISMLQRIGAAESQVRDLYSVIDRQTQQLTRLLDDLLDISRIASGKIVLKTSRMPLGRAVADAVEAVRPYVESMQHSLEVSVEDEGIEVEGDVARLAQVFTNLLDNAVKYTDEGGRITLTVRREGHDAVVRVRDSGIGLSPSQLPRIFEMFAQGDQSLERARSGLGVGLALSRTLVELHHGRIEAHSEGPGKGSELVVRLPMLPSTWASPTTSDATESAPSKQGLRILIADDNVDAVTVLAGALNHAGYAVHAAHDGTGAMAAADTFQPDVAILDIGMPKLDGYEVARRLRERFGKRLILVALTGWGQDEDRRRAMSAGFDHHLTKPVDLDALYRLIGTVETGQTANVRHRGGPG
jgi:PAS domain S-box-containing protein